MVIIRQKKKTMAQLKLWYGDYIAREVLVIMAEDFGMRATTFMWFGERYSITQALANIPDYLLDMRCDQFGVIRFFGGPPGKAKWYDGTLLTLICDATLFETYAHSR